MNSVQHEGSQCTPGAGDARVKATFLQEHTELECTAGSQTTFLSALNLLLPHTISCRRTRRAPSTLETQTPSIQNKQKARPSDPGSSLTAWQPES